MMAHAVQLVSISSSDATVEALLASARDERAELAGARAARAVGR